LGDQRSPHTGQLVIATLYSRTGQTVIGKLQIVKGVLEGISSSIAIAKALVQRSTKKYINIIIHFQNFRIIFGQVYYNK